MRATASVPVFGGEDEGPALARVPWICARRIGEAEVAHERCVELLHRHGLCGRDRVVQNRRRLGDGCGDECAAQAAMTS